MPYQHRSDRQGRRDDRICRAPIVTYGRCRRPGGLAFGRANDVRLPGAILGLRAVGIPDEPGTPTYPRDHIASPATVAATHPLPAQTSSQRRYRRVPMLYGTRLHSAPACRPRVCALTGAFFAGLKQSSDAGKPVERGFAPAPYPSRCSPREEHPVNEQLRRPPAGAAPTRLP